MTMNQTLRFQKKFAPIVTKTLMKLMKQYSLFEWVLEKKRPPEYLKDYHHNLNVSNTSLKVKYHLNSNLSYNKLSPSYTYFVMSISSHVEPNTYSEVVKHDCWRELYSEIFALDSNQIWEIALMSKDKTVICFKWIFKIKYKADGTIERYKARFSGKGIHTNRGHWLPWNFLSNNKNDHYKVASFPNFYS